MSTERQHYITHIRRLQAENTVLRSVIAEERMARLKAWAWYRKKVRNFLPMMLESWMLRIMGGFKADRQKRGRTRGSWM